MSNNRDSVDLDEDDFFCDKCSNHLHETFYELIWSSRNSYCHVVCPVCFGQLQAQRGCNPTFACPAEGCENEIRGHCCHTPSVINNDDGIWGSDNVPLPGPVLFHSPPDENKDAVRIYHDRPPNFQDQHILLAASFLRTSKENSEVKELVTTSVEVPFLLDCDDFDDVVKKKLILIAKTIYHLVVSPMEQYYMCRQTTPIDTVIKFEEFALEDPSFRVKFCVGMWTGKNIDSLLPEGKNSNVYQKSNFLAIYAGVEQMMRSTSTYPGPLQNIVQRLLSNENASQRIKSGLCKLRISASREVVRLENIKEVSDQLVKGWSLSGKKYWLAFVMFDNLGFRVLGANAGYDQYIVIAVLFVSPKQLQKIGFYCRHDSPERPLSRERQDWEIIRLNLSPKDILPSDKDYTTLGTFVYARIDSVLKICNKIPSVRAARELIASRESICFDTKLPGQYGSQRRVELSEHIVEAEQHEEFEEDEIEPYTPTLLNQEDQEVKLDVPMHADLNKKKSVENLTKGALHLRSRILNTESSDNDPNTNERPIMEDHGICQGCDGSPAYAFHTLKSDNARKYENTFLHSGSFHMHMKTLNAIGTMFSSTHLWHCLDIYRDTDKKKEFYLFPSDPGQTILEQPEMALPHYVAAARSLSAQDNNKEISAIDVHEYMLERACHYNICHIILMWLHFVEISNMIQYSEGWNDPELCRTGATLAMLLYAKTHCTKYIRIGFEQYVWWKTSSEADKILRDKFYFTKTTSRGKTIWFDRFVEWVNKDIRSYLGKYKKPNQELLMTRTSLLMTERLRRKGEDCIESRKHKQNHDDKPIQIDKDIAISPIFCSQLDLVYRHNFWGEGPVRVGEDNDQQDSTSFQDPSGAYELNPKLLFLVTDAEDALQWKFRGCYLADPSEREEHAKYDSQFYKVPPRIEDMEQDKKDEMTRLTSTKAEKIKNVCTKEYMKKRAKNLEEEYEFLKQCENPKSGDDKIRWAEHLAAYHKNIIDSDKNFVHDTQSRIDTMHSINLQTHEQDKLRELSKPFYRFTEESRKGFISSTYEIDCELAPVPKTPVRTRNSSNNEKTPAFMKRVCMVSPN